ncbi:hypothetical protein, partial [Dialister succinatiphilus]|uniref:hypothetical protein n=1 Tax=Dialister succinatiphilus TaxID=487173 RepID=UPI003F815A8F
SLTSRKDEVSGTFSRQKVPLLFYENDCNPSLISVFVIFHFFLSIFLFCFETSFTFLSSIALHAAFPCRSLTGRLTKGRKRE